MQKKSSRKRKPSYNTIWPLHLAKAQLSELVKKAVDSPQHISLRGKPVVVVISAELYKVLTIPSTSLVDFFRQSPLVGSRIDLSRDKSKSRDTEL